MTSRTERRATLLQAWEAQVVQLREAIAGLSEEELGTIVEGERWTVGQILYHAAAGLTYPRDLHEIALTSGEATAADMRLYDPPADESPSQVELLTLLDARAEAARRYLAQLSDDAFFAATPITMPSGRRFDASLPTALASSIDHQREHLEQVREWLRRGQPVKRRLADERPV
jgi:hypothetical protein